MLESLASFGSEFAALRLEARGSRFLPEGVSEDAIQISVVPENTALVPQTYLWGLAVRGSSDLVYVPKANWAKSGSTASVNGDLLRAAVVNAYISEALRRAGGSFFQISHHGAHSSNTASTTTHIIDCLSKTDWRFSSGGDLVQHWIPRERDLGKTELHTLVQPNIQPDTVRHTAVHGRLADWSVEADRIVRELGRLRPGWAGPGTSAPLTQAINDFDAVANMLPPDTVAPIVEVDDDDGYVSLRWRHADGSGSFALVFNGKHQAIGTMSPTGSYLPWKLEVADEVHITEMLDHEDVLRIITGK